MIFAAVCGCADDPAPPAAVLDGGPRTDARPPDGEIDATTAGRRDGGPWLPPADLTLSLPYGGPVQTIDLEVEADLGRLDVAFSIDTTGSFGQEIDTLQADLGGTIVPRLRERVTDVAFAVNRFEDMPDEPWGVPGDRPFELLVPMTTDVGRTASAVAALDDPLGHGGDVPESGGEALYQIATGDGYRAASRTVIPPYAGSGVGGVGFREGAFRVIVHATDAPAHAPADYGARFPGTRSVDDAIGALAEIDARVVGIASGEAARPQLEALALGTGATIEPEGSTCATGIDGAPRDPIAGVCPMVFSVAPDGTGLTDTIVDAIVDLVNSVAYAEVFGESVDDPLRFVRAIEARDATPPSGVAAPAVSDLRPADGTADTFEDVRTGTLLRFTAHFANRTLPPADYDQVFRVVVEIRGDGLLLASRRVRVVVPRGRLDAGAAIDADIPDAAGDGG